MSKNKPSAWHIWLHPRRTSREMQDLHAENTHLLQLNSELKTENESTRQLLNHKEEMLVRNENLHNRQVETMRLKIAELESTNSEVNKELQEWRQASMELDAINEQLSKWEDVKAGYEKQIEQLRLRLRESLGSRSSDRIPSFESDLVDDDDIPCVTRLGKRVKRPEDDSDDWLKTLPG